MNLNLQGKVAIITGASAGIGKAIFKLFLEENCHIVACSRNLPNLKRTLKELIKYNNDVEIHAIEADVHNYEDAKRVCEYTLSKFNQIDILINNSEGPVLKKTQFENISELEWTNCFQGKLHGYIRMSQLVIPIMKNQKSGRIINIIGLSGKEPMLDTNRLAAGIINAALINFTKSLAKNLAKWNILVNGVNPGYINTPRFKNYLLSQSMDAHLARAKVKQHILKQIPLHKIGESEDVANLVLFLASERAKYIDGVTINIDGGLSNSAF